MSYLISGDDGGDIDALKHEIQSLGLEPAISTNHPELTVDGILERSNKKVTMPPLRLLIMYPDSNNIGFDHSVYNMQCDVQNIHEANSVYPITRKDSLHKNLAGTEFIAPTWNLNDYKFTGAPVILRPSHMLANSGKDVICAATRDQFEQAKRFYEEKRAAHSTLLSPQLKYYQVIVSQYIDRPLTYDGRKMHLRLYAISTTRSGGTLEFAPVGQLLLARDKFAPSDFANSNVHDTHYSSTGMNLTYPEDFPRQDYLPNFRKWLTRLSVVIAKFFSPKSYPQAKQSYICYGLDIMFWEDGTPVLIEINDRPGRKRYPGNNSDFYKRVYEWEMSFAKRLLDATAAPTTGGDEYPRVWLISGESSVDNTRWFEHLRGAGYTPASAPAVTGVLPRGTHYPTPVGLLEVFSEESPFDPATFNIPARVQNVLDAEYNKPLTLKARLHANPAIKPFVAPTWPLDQFTFARAKVAILRPSGSGFYSGRDIFVVDTPQSLSAADATYARISERARVKPTFIASAYIDRPLTYSGRKMHLRLYAIATSQNNIPTFDFSPVGKLLLAKLPYKSGDWSNPLIHDTHFKTTGDDIIFPDQFPKQEYLPRFRTWLGDLRAAILTFYQPQPYPQAASAFEIFGVDIMFWDDGTPVLIEINDRVGMKTQHPGSPRVVDFYKRYHDWCWEKTRHLL